MARAVHTDGTEPVKTRTIKREGGIEIELPYCNMCQVEMHVIRLGTILFWKPGWKYTRKYPLRYGTFLCDSCREEMGFNAYQYVAVPCGEDQDMIEAMKAHIDRMERAGKELKG